MAEYRERPPQESTIQQPQELVDTQDYSNQYSFSRLVIILAALAFTLFVSFIDQTSVSTALPAIAKSLDAYESISWVGTSFLVANTSFQLINGRLSDIFGRKNCLMTCMALLAIGDLLCGFAKTPAQLYVFRGIAGVGAGGINSLVMIMFTDMTTLEQRGKYQGLLETNIALGNGVGPLIGGAFSQSSATWRWAFWFVVPVTVMAAVPTYLTSPKSKLVGNMSEKLRMIDYGGMVLSLSCVIFLLIPISSGGTTWSWSSPLIISFLVIGACLVVLFVVFEWKYAKYPVMPLRVFDRRSAKILFMHNLLTGIVYYSDLYYLPLYFQVVLGHSPLESGLLILPLILGFSASSTTAGFLLSRLGRCNPVIWAGYVMWTAGAGTHIAFGSSTSIGVTIGCLLVEGFGIGFSFQPVMIALLANTRKEDRAVVTGMRNFIRTVGGAIGLAICAAIINNVLQANLPPSMPSQSGMEMIGKLDQLTPGEQSALREAYMKGLDIVFRLACPLIGFCLLTSAALTDVPLATAHEPQEQSGPAIDEKDSGAASSSPAKTEITIDVDLQRK
ncbi:MFS general substrate transporter [Eremomyces bilateralis CBS 781.70]|uniref:MFS general substrate transporter n=1 Tax=Eremomyces bilateralis CBS 781.70 TaxID=1392243 RepID=A0A6G1GCN3_9PEZI|nr:MFS general substrate transporter [Eremomyces bilateralis CBS 781.70]KAF1815651.1 MFS general substrate transporter [Eremomyces bilateralis CBS 781.70]